MKIYVGDKEVNQEDFLEHMVNTLKKCYDMDYSKMESHVDMDKVLKEFENITII